MKIIWFIFGIVIVFLLFAARKESGRHQDQDIQEIDQGHLVYKRGDNATMLRSSFTPDDGHTSVESAVESTVDTSASMVLAVIVLTARDFKDRRKAIRETWGNGHSNVFFIVGKHCPYRPDQRKPWVCEPKNANAKIDIEYNAQQEALTQQLSQESNVIIVDMIDVYRNLADKLFKSYRWIIQNTNAKYVLKMDDDSFARVDSVEHWLKKRPHPPKYEIIAGAFSKGQVPRRGKWAENKYKSNKYPPWPSGAGHVVSRLVIEYLHENAETWVSYQGEDTSMGIWMENVRPQLNVQQTNSEHFITHSGDCHNKNKFVIGHSISIAKLRECYNTMDEYEHVTGTLLDKDVCINKPSGAMWNTFTSMINVLNNLNANYTISSGTVISWYRDCSLGFSDIDMNIDLDWFTKNQYRLHEALIASGWRQEATFGTFGDVGYEEAWKKNNIKTDLFSMAYVDGRYINGLTISHKVYPCDSFLERYETHTWNNISFQVPAPIEPYLQGKYGNWRTKHVHGYVWSVEPFKTADKRRHCVRDHEEMKKLQLKYKKPLVIAAARLDDIINDACDSSSYKLTQNDFKAPSYFFKGPYDKQIPFAAGVHTECDLLHNNCKEIQQGNAKAPDRWLVNFIEVTMKKCTGCLSFDFGSNLGLVSLSLLSMGSSVVSIEPQLDLCCASRVSSSMTDKHISYCGGVKTSSQTPTYLEISVQSPGFRDGWAPTSQEMHVLFKSLGLPDLYKVPLINMREIIDKGIQSFGNNIEMVKIDTDSIDCTLVREILDSSTPFSSITFETWSNDECAERSNFVRLLRDLQQNGYEIYHTPAQQDAYSPKYIHKQMSLVANIIYLKDSRLWQLLPVKAMSKNEQLLLHNLRNVYQMVATNKMLTDRSLDVGNRENMFYLIWEDMEKNPDLQNPNYENIVRNSYNSVKTFGYDVTLMSNSLTWGTKYNVYELAANSPLDESIFERVYSGTHPMVHMSDIIRFLFIYHYGGSYIDADSIMQNNRHIKSAIEEDKMLLMRSPNNHINCNVMYWGAINYSGERFYISNGLLHNFRPKSPLATNMLVEMNKRYDSSTWSSIGPHLITYVWNNLKMEEKSQFKLVEWKDIYVNDQKSCPTCDFYSEDFQKKKLRRY